MATLYDVAKLARVSPKTVSRVLNEEHLVAEETRERVLEAIRKLDYYPNAIATSLKKKRSNIIGFVVPYGSDFVFQDPNMMEQLRGTHDLLSEEGYEVILSAPLHNKDALQKALRLIKHRSVDGVILYPSMGVDKIIAEFEAKNFSYVTLGICSKGQTHNYVEVDQTTGAYLATKYLLTQGRRRIGLLNKPSSFFIYQKDDMIHGYRIALAEAGVEFRPELVREGDFTLSGGYQACRSLMKIESPPQALICASDPMTYGALKALEDLELEVERDIQVVAGDNLPLTQKLFPFISSITNPSYHQGRLAGEMIISVIQGEEAVPGINLETGFVEQGIDRSLFE